MKILDIFQCDNMTNIFFLLILYRRLLSLLVTQFSGLIFTMGVDRRTRSSWEKKRKNCRILIKVSLSSVGSHDRKERRSLCPVRSQNRQRYRQKSLVRNTLQMEDADFLLIFVSFSPVMILSVFIFSLSPAQTGNHLPTHPVRNFSIALNII